MADKRVFNSSQGDGEAKVMKSEASSTTRRIGASATQLAARQSSVAGPRASGGLSKPPTRPPVSAPRKSTTSASVSSHQSGPSVSASDDEKRSPVMQNASRRTSSIMLSPRKTADRKPVAVTKPAATRKAITSSSATSSNTSSHTPRPGATTAGSSTVRNMPGRQGNPAGGAQLDTRRKLATPASTNASSRTPNRSSMRSEVLSEETIATNELSSKLAERDAEIQAFKSRIDSLESTIAKMSTEVEIRTSMDSGTTNMERRESLGNVQPEEDATEVLLAQLLVTTERLRDAEADLAMAIQAKKEEEEAREALKSSLETLNAENLGKLRVLDSNLQISLRDHAVDAEKLQSAQDAKQQLDVALSDLRSEFESLIKDHEREIEQMKASHIAESSLKSDAETSERNALTATVENLEGEIVGLKSKLMATQSSFESATVTAEDTINDLSERLMARQHELATADKAVADMRSEINDIQVKLAERDSKISDLERMHDIHVRQIIQDNEHELEKLSGDGSLKQRFEDLEIEHRDLKTRASEAADKYATSIAASRDDHSLALSALATQEAEHQTTLDTLRAKHAEQLHHFENKVSAIEERHDGEINALKTKHSDQLHIIEVERDALLSKRIQEASESHKRATEDMRQSHAEEKNLLLEGNSKHVEEIARLNSELQMTKAELEQVKSNSAEQLEASRHELEDNYAAEVEKLIEMHTVAMASLKADGAQTKRDLEELAASHTKAIDDIMAEYRNKNTTHEVKLSAQTSINLEIQTALDDTTASLTAAQSEIESLRRQLAQGKLNQSNALVEVDALRSIKHDTIALDALKVTIQSLEEALQSTKAQFQTKQEELKSTENELKIAQDRLLHAEQKVSMAEKAIAGMKTEALEKAKTAQADYNDLNESMTTLVEEANARTKELEVKINDLVSQVERGSKRTEEVEAQLRVRNVELTEVTASAKYHGLASGGYAETKRDTEDAAAAGNVAEGENDSNHSSAALALLSKVRLTAKQVDALDREMRDRNLKLLNSITDVKMSG